MGSVIPDYREIYHTRYIGRMFTCEQLSAEVQSSPMLHILRPGRNNPNTLEIEAAGDYTLTFYRRSVKPHPEMYSLAEIRSPSWVKFPAHDVPKGPQPSREWRENRPEEVTCTVSGNAVASVTTISAASEACKSFVISVDRLSTPGQWETYSKPTSSAKKAVDLGDLTPSNLRDAVALRGPLADEWTDEPHKILLRIADMLEKMT